MDRVQLARELQRDEGVRFKPYKDTVGKLTIGIGRNLTDKGISSSECAMLLNNDIDETLDLLDKFLPWWRNLDEVRQRVLANMCFNLGIESLLGFRNTLRLVQEGKYGEAAENGRQSLWFRQVGIRAQRLMQAMESGVMPD